MEPTIQVEFVKQDLIDCGFVDGPVIQDPDVEAYCAAQKNITIEEWNSERVDQYIRESQRCMRCWEIQYQRWNTEE